MAFSKSSWIGINALRRLRQNLVNLELDEDLVETLDDYLQVNNDGEYLINIFTDVEIRRLKELDEDWDLI